MLLSNGVCAPAFVAFDPHAAASVKIPEFGPKCRNAVQAHAHQAQYGKYTVAKKVSASNPNSTFEFLCTRKWDLQLHLTWHYKPGRINVADPISRSPALQTNVSAVDVAAQEWRDWLLRSQRGEGPATKRSVDIEEGRTLGVLLATRSAWGATPAAHHIPNDKTYDITVCDMCCSSELNICQMWALS